MITTLHGDCLTLLPTLPAASVQCIVTSPPYYGLRDYDLPPTLWPPVSYAPMALLPGVDIPGCALECTHEWGDLVRAPWANEVAGPGGRRKNPDASRSRPKTSGQYCQRCGGWLGCLGLEPDPLAYIGHLVLIFRELHRVLADDGVCWLNIGDSYAGSWQNYSPGGIKNAQREQSEEGQRWERPAYADTTRRPPTAHISGLPDKNLIGTPWRLAFALQADGWYLRSDVIWSKPNAMPESVLDRPTKSHEYIFLLAKSERYSFDMEAIKEPTEKKKTRNRRTVWSVATRALGEQHYASYPEELAQLGILAGSRAAHTVLDPFAGSGTTLRVAESLGRNSIGIELSDNYLEIQQRRTDGIQLMHPALLEVACPHE